MTDKEKVLKALQYLASLPTFQDLAKEAKIDKSTLSRALKNEGDPERRELTENQVKSLLEVLKKRKLIK